MFLDETYRDLFRYSTCNGGSGLCSCATFSIGSASSAHSEAHFSGIGIEHHFKDISQQEEYDLHLGIIVLAAPLKTVSALSNPRHSPHFA